MAAMGLFETRWEADHEGHRVAVTRSEWTKGLRLSWDGRLLARKRWSMLGTGELAGEAHVNGQPVSVRVTVAALTGCRVDIDGRAVAVRKVR
jgi:hypothetical protein